jgi:xanthine dehydrogenase accessory factor
MLELIKTLETCWETKSQAAIATIVQTSGSTYRSAGAKSIILADGTILGTLSGGCIESDIFEHAKTVMSSQVPKMIEYDFFGDEDLPWGLGVGCNGSLKIWIEPFDPKRQKENTLQILTIFQNQLSSITITHSSKPNLYPIGTKFVLEEEQIERFKSKGLYPIQQDHVQLEVYYEQLKRIPRLVIFGAGPDAVPLVRGAKLLNWRVTIVDHRPGFANHEKFPEADEILTPRIGNFPENLKIHEKDYAVIMTHHFEQDSLFLDHLLSCRLGYLGILGPKKRTSRILKEKADFKVDLNSPIGLDIGAETPEEIAFSILAEIVSHVNESPGISLKHQDGPIHKKWDQLDRSDHLAQLIFEEFGSAKPINIMD